MKNKKKNIPPWFISSLLITILGAMSILLLFLMQYYETRGVFFWAVVTSWIIILITISIIFCIQDNLRKKKDNLIRQLTQEIEELKRNISS